MPGTKNTHNELTGAMKRLVDDPESYNQFIDASHKHISAEVDDMDTLVARPNQDLDLGGIADEAQNTLSAIAIRDKDGHLRDDVAQMLNNFPHAAFMIARGGKIRALNDLAFIENGIDVGNHIDDLGYILECSQSLGEAVGEVIAKSAKTKNVVLKRGFGSDGKRTVTFALIYSASAQHHEDRVLLFVVDPVWRKEAGTLMQSAFGFTKAEMEIVDGFMSGETLRQIADGRERSHTTVRTQFQKLMEKAGARNQLELMRVALGLSQFVGEIEPIAKVALAPQRKRVDVLRPSNRTVDVLFYGDPEGTPVVFIQSMFFRCFTSNVELKLKQAGLHFIAPARPGFGATSMPANGEDVNKCIAKDVEAILDQMEIDKFILVGQTVGSPACFAICDHLGHRITRAILCGAAVPIRPDIHLDTTKFGSKWTSAIGKAAKISPRIAYLVARAAHRLMLTTGTLRFLSQFYEKSASDLAVFTDPDAIREFERGVAFMLNQGIAPVVDSVIACFEDWSNLVENAKIQVIMAHGSQDPHAPVHAIKAFCDLYSKKTKMLEIPDAGQLLMLSHTDEIIELIKGTKPEDILQKKLAR